MWERISAAWCRKMHDEAMWPMHGRYICRKCLREHRVTWEGSYSEPSALVESHQPAAGTASASMDACA
jgi:hypothetical protein